MSYQGGKWQNSVVGPEGEILLAESGGEKSERSVAAEVVLLNRFVRREWADDGILPLSSLVRHQTIQSE